MRARSNTIFAENIEDYITQLKSIPVTHPSSSSPDTTLIHLFNFDSMSLDTSSSSSNHEEDQFQDLLGADATYNLKLKDLAEDYNLIQIKKPFISIKHKRLMMKKRKTTIDSSEYAIKRVN